MTRVVVRGLINDISNFFDYAVPCIWSSAHPKLLRDADYGGCAWLPGFRRFFPTGKLQAEAREAKKTELNMLGLAGQKKPWGSAGRTLGRTPMSIYNSAGGVWVETASLAMVQKCKKLIVLIFLYFLDSAFQKDPK